MRVFITGAQGVGKSTLNLKLQELEYFKDLKVLDSVSRKFASSVNDFKDPEKLKLFQTRIASYCFNEYLDDNFISSRGLADTYAYCTIQYKETGDDRYRLIAELALDLAKDVGDTSNIHIYIPIMFSIEDNGMRSTDIKFQKRVDNLIKEYYNITKIRLLEISKYDVNDRVLEVVDYMEKFL